MPEKDKIGMPPAHEIEPSEVHAQPVCCPMCGGNHLRRNLVQWMARSDEDSYNVAHLTEHQCGDCSVSFWV